MVGQIALVSVWHRILNVIIESLLYNSCMARGWESKSVEAQQDEASKMPDQSRKRLTPEEASRRRILDGLRLAKQRTAQQLAAATNSRHRQMLESALADMERKIAEAET